MPTSLTLLDGYRGLKIRLSFTGDKSGELVLSHFLHITDMPEIIQVMQRKMEECSKPDKIANEKET